MRCRWNIATIKADFIPWASSIGLHAGLVGIPVLIFIWQNLHSVAEVDFTVVQNPVLTSTPLKLDQPVPPKEEPKKTREKVFGINKKALTESAQNAAPIAVKQGNTLATPADNKKLDDKDAEALPIPTDEYLVSSMPSLLTEVKIDYPPEAKAKKISGPVSMDLLIDELGKVRQVTLIASPDPLLAQAAMQAVQNFKFRPARVQEKSVAVRIRYIYRFVLEKS